MGLVSQMLLTPVPAQFLSSCLALGSPPSYFLFPDVAISFTGAARAPGASDFPPSLPHFPSFSCVLPCGTCCSRIFILPWPRGMSPSEAPSVSLLASLHSQTSWPSGGRQWVPLKTPQPAECGALSEASQKSSSIQLSSQCWFKLRVS